MGIYQYAQFVETKLSPSNPVPGRAGRKKMAIIQEQTYGEFARLEVLHYNEKGNYNPWKIISIEIDSMERLTPMEMRKLGKWLVKESKRLGKEYTASGAFSKRNS